ncbi:unnamed protein product [Acanthocheilonema viteae]|uniref:Uncharacterized protein n=1 Tax=Acanthocheilonema viteae TaxID=6277 RepID=A0A498SAK5_ACAVI|nr:unnamed protein product [Acanthocheilonema viteae]
MNMNIEIDPATFEIPQYYRSLNNGDYGICISGNTAAREVGSNGNLASRYVSEDELYLQFALEQSMREAAGPPTASASSCFEGPASNVSDWHEDTDLAYAIRESIRTLRLEQLMREDATPVDDTNTTERRQTFMDDDIQLAIRLSKKEEEERLKACEEQEEELKRIIKLSLIEK